MQKGQAVLWIVVGILIIIAVAGGAYYLGSLKNQQAVSFGNKSQNSVVTSQTSQPTPDKIANWKTYTVEANNFSIKYPANWEFKDPSNSSSDERIGTIVVFQNQTNKTYGQDGQGYTDFVYYSTVAPDATRNMGLVDPKSYIKESDFLDPNNNYWAKTNPEQTIVGGKKAMKQIVSQTSEHQETNLRDNQVIYWIWLGDRIIELSLVYDSGSSDKDNLVKTFDQMVSTIKFISPCLGEWRDTVKNLVDVFENLQMKKDALGVLALFTAPVNDQDITAYNFFTGKDTGSLPRLYNNAATNINEPSYKIVGDPMEGQGKCVVNVEEQIRPYSNAGPNVGYGAPETFKVSFDAVKQGNVWRIDNYYPTGQAIHKYSAWGY